MENALKYIPNIYNYCDRWCERCPFTEQCANYEKAGNTDLSDPNEFIEKLQQSFTEAMKLVEKAFKEQGMDWEKLKEDAKNFELEEPTLSKTQEALNQLSKQYHQIAGAWLKTNNKLLEQKEIELRQKNRLGINIKKELEDINNALEYIHHYLFFIAAKVRRAFNGLHDQSIMKESQIQNDSNGSAKIAIIATERSLGAWEIVRQSIPESEDELLDILSMLSQILRGMKGEFPKVNQFIRPGFDG